VSTVIDTRSKFPSSRLRLLAVALLVFAGACAVNPVSQKREIVLVSVEDEIKMGDEAAAEVERDVGFYENQRIDGYLDAIGARLEEFSPWKDVGYDFYVVEMIEPNAFALPGGHVYVSRGLLALMNDEAELAGVVGHEMGHVAARHAVQRMTRAAPVGVLTGITSGIVGMVSPALGSATAGIGGLTNALVVSPYSRSQENEADEIGQSMAAQAGWDPAALTAFLETLGKEEALSSDGKRPPTFLSSHPSTPSRIEKTAERAGTLQRAATPPIAKGRDAFLQYLNGLPVGPRAAEGVFIEERFLHPDMKLALSFPEGWKTQNTRNFVVGVSKDEKAAIVLLLHGEGTDPAQAGRDFLEQEVKMRPQDIEVTATTIGGLPAARSTLSTRDQEVRLAWIAQGGRIFRLMGLVKRGSSSSHDEDIQAAISSYRVLGTAERAEIREDRLRLIEAKKGETLAGLIERVDGQWEAPQAAVANGLREDRVLEAGRLVKMPISERY